VTGRTLYDWERFWVSADRRIEIDSDAFFPDPRSEHGWLRPSMEANTLEELKDEPCLILLGEPGLGKSQAVEDAVAAASSNSLTERINLAAYPDASSIRSKLIEGTAWREWIEQGRPLHLYLDSFDEATLSFRSIPKFLIEELRSAQASLDTLYLRIACRSAEWMDELADGLREIWPSRVSAGAAIRRVSLAPLRERDVLTAATAEGFEGATLLAEIRDRGVEGLASLPLTLRMMLDAVREGSSLPRTQSALYESGVRHLLDEPDPYRRKGESSLRMEIGERLAVAERISAAVLLSRRSGVSLLPGHAGPGDVDPAEIAGFEEVDRLAAGGDRFKVGTEAVLETLRTALFAMVSRERVGFSHRSLGEFCAGAYLANADLDQSKLGSLLFAASDAEGRLVPQLREVAAWAASLSTNALDAVLAGEPEVLLRIDRLELDEEQRAQVVAAILNQESAERIGRWDRRVWRSLAALDHPGLPGQLDPLIADPEADWSVRRLAITIARVCERRDCEPALLGLALSETEPAWMRDDGVWALREYGSRSSKEALIPLALKTIEDDVDDEIKGSALMAVFPGLVSVEQVFGALTPPRNTHLIGAYSSYLHKGLPECLGRADLPVALRWAAGTPITHGPNSGLDSLVDSVLAKAWPLLGEDAEIAELVADVARPRLKAHVDLLSSIDRGDHREVFQESVGRRRLVEELIPDITRSELHAAALMTSSPTLLRSDDLSWALSHVDRSPGTAAESAWVQVASMAFALPVSDDDLEQLERLCRTSPEMKEQFGYWLTPVQIDSDEAYQMRELYRPSRRQAEDLPDRAKEMEDAVAAELAAAEAGEDDGWWRLNHTLLFNEHGRSDPRLGEWEADLTALPGWRRSSPSVQARIADLAGPSLDREPPPPDEWFAGPTFNRGAYAGYRALYLLAKFDREAFLQLDASVWERWMPIVIDFPSTTASDEEGTSVLIRRRAAEMAESSFASWAERKLTAQAETAEGHLFFRHSLDGITGPELDERIVSMLTGRALRPNSLRDLLPTALSRDPQRSLELIAPRLRQTKCEFTTDEEREIVILCAAKLLGFAPSQAWPEVSSLLERCPDVGPDVLLSLAHEERSSIAAEMSDEHLSAFLTWIFGEFPQSSDPPMEEGIVSPRESLTQYRQWLLEALADRGTDQAVAALKALHDRHDTPGLRFALRKAQDVRREKSPAPEPGDIVRAVCGAKEMPRSDPELLSLVCSVLRSIGASLQVAQPPAAAELWNTRPPQTPKDEGDLSNWLSIRLANELGPAFDVSRERLVSGGGVGRGKSADIQIVCPGPKKLQALIEVKGCWERELLSKMETQLADDYMATTGVVAGVYVVFWFDQPSWDSSDGRRRSSGFATAEIAEKQLSEQAASISAKRKIRIETVVLDGSLDRRSTSRRSST
jgi:hypothetical protein